MNTSVLPLDKEYERIINVVNRSIEKYCPDLKNDEDLLQDIYLYAMERAYSFMVQSPYDINTHILSKFIKKSSVNVETVEYDKSVEEFNTIKSITLKHLRDSLDEAMDGIPNRESEILSMRFGLYSNNGMSLHQVGDELGMNYKKVRCIEAKALRLLRHPSKSNKYKLRDYLYELDLF